VGVIDVGTTADSLRLGARCYDAGSCTNVGDAINMNCPNAGDLYVGTADGSLEFYNGAVGAFSIWDDQLSAAEFLDIAGDDYGSPGPTFDDMTTAATTYSTAGENIPITGTTSEEVFITGSPPYFDCTAGVDDLRFYWSSKDTTDIVIASATLVAGQRTNGLTCDASWTIPSGGTVTDTNSEDATLTLPAITNAASVDISIPYTVASPATVGAGGDFTAWSNFAAIDIASDASELVAAVTDVTIDLANQYFDSKGYGADSYIISGNNVTAYIGTY
jgi:hypothetical protein